MTPRPYSDQYGESQDAPQLRLACCGVVGTDHWGTVLAGWWARQGLNLWPLPCQGSALPLSYAPIREKIRVRHASGKHGSWTARATAALMEAHGRARFRLACSGCPGGGDAA